jgi:hypothetical protein
MSMTIRCPTCHATHEVGACPQAPLPELTAQRNESSVLFSLSMLTAAPPPPRPEQKSSDNIMSLDVGVVGRDVYAPVLAAPVELPRPRDPSRIVWAAALSAGALVATAIVCAAFVLKQHAPHPAAITTPVPLPMLTPLPSPTLTPSPTPTLTPSPTLTPPPTPTVATHVATPTVTVAPLACCPGESDSACQIRRAVGAQCESHDFDRAAATRALEAVDISMCKNPSAPSGQGHVVVMLQADGTASKADVDAPPFAGTEAGRCIARAYRRVRVPAFTGAPVTVGKRFNL